MIFRNKGEGGQAVALERSRPLLAITCSELGPQAEARFILFASFLCLKHFPRFHSVQTDNPFPPLKSFIIFFPRNGVTFQNLVQIVDILGLVSALQPHPSYFSHV